jgi:hypothetical protein
MKSVIHLRKWIAEQLKQVDGNDDVNHVLRYIRRKTDHPCYTEDEVILEQWRSFLSEIDCYKISRSELR